MKFQTLTLALMGFAGLSTVGCEIHEHHDPRPVIYDDRGPVVVDTYYYYDRGYYDGPYWVYRDRDDHWYRERHEDHERREREWETHGRGGRAYERSGHAEHGNAAHGGGEHSGGNHGGGVEGRGGDSRGR